MAYTLSGTLAACTAVLGERWSHSCNWGEGYGSRISIFEGRICKKSRSHSCERLRSSIDYRFYGSRTRVPQYIFPIVLDLIHFHYYRAYREQLMFSGHVMSAHPLTMSPWARASDNNREEKDDEKIKSNGPRAKSKWTAIQVSPLHYNLISWMDRTKK